MDIVPLRENAHPETKRLILPIDVLPPIPEPLTRLLGTDPIFHYQGMFTYYLMLMNAGLDEVMDTFSDVAYDESVSGGDQEIAQVLLSVMINFFHAFKGNLDPYLGWLGKPATTDHWWIEDLRINIVPGYHILIDIEFFPYLGN